ncbi:MAG: hypothetical protein A3I77_00975 [Gammaproteobacteria bacterium RIFCSPLOWO2_02_FULL_42_14]|nr:MAG: hypothetical protein A3B71_04765 [Gammaproteobacteria bacterium RIFCSPHIGHO2_02_FULL_42_43]OGT28706.1 MAG: hypothetical protein A2624_05405 [Gammaproteobacteria bacterium RIFCSPHIGHO2_01_FULL_42_8]OGT61003.1 MAG: hypothetical protein A3I77_00975 [Gammaproteobacteria bacterium RIFCSPLOWO2_02_FULL_42_14]OGT85319.1 MAG: hypothetical protein A3G86_05610 [Gammaproteobacteria bacterium RIFCSPLOWO2_12_FULL_42_18]
MRLLNPKYKNSSVNEGEKITISLSAGSSISRILSGISTEENVISVAEKKFGENWYCVSTTLTSAEIDAFAAHLKQKYSLENCMRFVSMHEAVAVIPVDEKAQTSPMTSRNAMWKWGDAMEPSAAAIRESNARAVRGSQPGKTVPVETLEPPTSFTQ